MPAKQKTKPKAVNQVPEEPKEINKKDLIANIITKRPKEKFLTDNQKIYHSLLKKNQITICSGPAGVGKSFMAVKTAIELLTDVNSPYEKLIIVRPAVEAEEHLGSLPGSLAEKLDPYVFPTFYLLHKIIGKDATEKLKFHNIIEVHALAYMRGMNIDNSILVFEEAQNSTPSQMKLLLTRIGFNSKFFISGDLEQNDRYKDKRQTGLWDAMQRFSNVDDIAVFSFTDEDVVRNSIISKILKKYEN
jgi:phosphate starvation-inducible PhoH-like protein